MKRRRNHEGTLGQRKNGTWYASLRTGSRRLHFYGPTCESVRAKLAALQRAASGRAELPPKTATSRRTIKLPASVVAALRAWRKYQLKLRKWPVHGYVFTTHSGTPIDERNLTRIYEKILKAAKLPHHRFHDLRHTAASLLFAEGVPIKSISSVLGHSSVTITMDTYTHLLPAMLDDAARVMNDLVTGKK